MPVDDQDEVALTTQQRRGQKPRCIGDSWLFIVTSSVMAARIYGEDPPRITVSRNRPGLFIRQTIVAKINGKRKPRSYDTLGQISVNHSRTRCVPARLALQGARICFSPFPLIHTLVSAYIATYYLSKFLSISTSNVRLTSYHPPCMN
jgi:hypothetical protein